jgi:tetratricopeptide (TPR) repeat protein
MSILLRFGAVPALCVFWVTCGWSQTPAVAELSQAYQALAQKDYDAAIELFRTGLAKQPDNAGAHKDLAYTLLKTGDNAEARDEFEAALRLNQGDETAALEYAFLAYETKKPIEARRMFDRLRKRGMTATRAKAEEAFQNIDRPLAEGIARWQQALARSPKPLDITMFSAHWELAQLAELRDDLPLAAEQYEICRKLKPQMSELLLILGRVWMQLNRVEEARAALLAASRESDARTAEHGLEQWGSRYPYPYEFLKALDLDPKNIALRRELAYLYLAMQKQPDAEEQFEKLLAIDPNDKLSRDQLNALHTKKSAALSPAPAPPLAFAASTGASGVDARAMGMKSLALGYARDAIKYLRQAHDEDQDDAEVMLKLGYAYNYAKDDQDAVQWFNRAQHASDPQIAAEASKAYHNLNGDAVSQTTVWTLPMYSSRWHDLFSYGQVKRTMPLPWRNINKWFTVYVSTRFMGDLKSSMIPAQAAAPQYLSESSFIVAGGVSSRTWHHLTAWAEAGEAVKYLPYRHDIGAAIPDYRGGLNFAKGFGSLLGSSQPGMFFETSGDAVFVSRYDKNWIFNSQNRTGRTFHFWNGSAAQALFNMNYTRDMKNQYWANTVEMGPGLKVHMPWMRPGVYFSADFLRGVYTNNEGNPRRPNYDDIRVGFWYAFTK